MARSLVPHLTLLRGKGDWWWAGSLQQGYQWARHAGVPANDLVLIINDDTEIDPEFLWNAVAAMRPGSLLLAQAYKSNGDFCEAGVFWDWENLACRGVGGGDEINCFSTRGLFLYAGDLLKIGGFYPRLLPHYLSDYEFTIRARRKGLSLISRPEVSLRYSEALTGIRSTEGLSVWKTLVTNLSIRSTSNPVYWTSFVLLACPPEHALANVVRVWWRYLDPVRAKVRFFLSPVISPLRRNLGRVKRRLKRIALTPSSNSD
jgi:GT2 family glycosyltransferase